MLWFLLPIHSDPFVVNAGFRSPLVFWMGGGGDTGEGEPPADAVEWIIRARRRGRR